MLAQAGVFDSRQGFPCGNDIHILIVESLLIDTYENCSWIDTPGGLSQPVKF